MIEEIVEKAKKENKKVYIYAHKFPDGDAIASSSAVAEYLKKQGIDAQFVVTNPVRSFYQIVGNIPTTTSVEKDGISIILDTSTASYAENNFFKNSSPENTYVIDHHGKVNGSKCIEDELDLPTQNVIRDSDSSSTCEILINELDKTKITPQIANMLTLGLLTDTAKLKFLKANTLQNLLQLIQLGANYEQIISLCNRKSNLRDEVGIAQALLKTKTFPIGNTFGMILSINNEEVNELIRKFGVRSIQKKIFKMGDIEDCSFTCILAENTLGKYDTEFRSTPIYGNFNVLQLATLHNGGGHHNASGCILSMTPVISQSKSSEGLQQDELEKTLQQEASRLYSDQAINLSPIVLSDSDKELSQLLDTTEKLTTGITPEIIEKVDRLINNGANYDYTFKTFKSFKQFMLQNEILSRIPSSVYNQRPPNISISLSSEDVEALKRKYNIDEDEILASADVFSSINISSASVSLSNGKKVFVDHNGKVSRRDISAKNNFSVDI